MHELSAPLYRICRQAGKVLCDLYAAHLRQPLQVEVKQDASPVTIADRRSNEILHAGLERLCPGWAVLSEETPIPAFEQRREWRQYWLIDPLDGTREFIEGSGHFCISVALIEDDRPRLGAIYLPLTGQLYLGGVDQQAMVYTPGQQRILVPRPARRDALVKMLVSRRGSRDPRVQAFRRQLESRFPGVLTEKRGSAWKFCRIAEGSGQIYPRFGATSEWDTAAGQALLEAVGGVVADLDGRPLRYNRRPELENPPFLALGPASFDWQGLL